MNRTAPRPGHAMSTRLAGLLFLVLTLSGGCATQRARMEAIPLVDPPLGKVARHYHRGCACGQRLSNNCAHYLSNAFIRAGYNDLKKCRQIAIRCRAKRVIRAQDMLWWFQHKSKRFHAGKPPQKTGFWAVYQEKPGQRHVLLYDSDTGRYYGTDNCVDWPIQWYYQW